MKKIIYIEKEIRDFYRTKLILKKFKDPEVIYIDRYGEIFNKKNQNFKTQKSNPAFILAKKYKKLLHKTPENYGIGNRYNYYFSYMYNCIFDCRYCFLQGLYSSANFVIFVNYEDFLEKINQLSFRYIGRKITLFSGYDCDSLALEQVSGFMNYLINHMHNFKNIDLEIRTKSTNVLPFTEKPQENIIIAYSFTPERFSKKYEKGVPSVKKRISALSKLSKMGWRLGLRIDPIIIYEGWERDYLELFDNIFTSVDFKKIHSITFGKLRFPESIYKKIIKDNLSEKLFFNLQKTNNMYENPHSACIEDFFIRNLKNFVDKRRIFFNN